MPSRLSPLACVVALALAASAATAAHPPARPKLFADPGDVCVDMGATPPGVDPECRAVSVRDLYEEVCSPLDLCLVQAAVDHALDATCAHTGQMCDWREEPCLADVFGCGPVSRAERVANGVDDFVLHPRPPGPLGA